MDSVSVEFKEALPREVKIGDRFEVTGIVYVTRISQAGAQIGSYGVDSYDFIAALTELGLHMVVYTAEKK